MVHCLDTWGWLKEAEEESFDGRSKDVVQEALPGLRRIDLDGLRWRVFDAKGQTRYKVDKDCERDWCMKVMGELWRASKSRLVSKLNELPNEQERLKLKPDNIKSETEWRVFVREKTSKQFQGFTQPSEVDSHMPSPMSVNLKFTLENNACNLLDWDGSGEIVAEGRWSSSDPLCEVHHLRLGPNAMRIWVDVAKKPTAYLWRPTSHMSTIEEAVGSTVAWPSSKVTMRCTTNE